MDLGELGGRNDVTVSKVNAPGPIETNAHLLRYDSVHGRFPGKVDVNQTPSILEVVPLKYYPLTMQMT